MRERLDKSSALARLITLFSNALAEQRGLVPVIGIGIAALGIVLLLINVFLGLVWLQFIGVLLQGFGMLSALVGLLLAEPLGK